MDIFFATMIWVTMFDTMYAIADRDDDLEININSTAIFLENKISPLLLYFKQFLSINSFYWVFQGFGYCFYLFCFSPSQ